MMRHTKTGILSLLLLVLLVAPISATIYVDGTKSDNSGNGLSWSTAKKTVQAAIDAASSGSEVWVKAVTGCYNEHITMKTGVSIYGGFAGTETQRDQRNWTTNVTCLDGAGLNNSVITANAGVTTATFVDGFTIQHGTGRPSSPNMYGGGICCNGGSLTISHNRIINNTATHGGGVFAPSSSAPVIEYNTIQGNQASFCGGGISMYNGSVRHNTISLNTNPTYGGGVYVSSYADQITISNNTITENQASTGAGVYSYGNAVQVLDNMVSGNAAANTGGGVFCGGGTVTIEGNEVSDNTAAVSGGIDCSQGSATISGNTVDGNQVTSYGGICTYECTAVITNNIVTNNTATAAVGGIACAYGGSPEISGNTITGNSGVTGGGGMHVWGNVASITNNLIEGNNAGTGGGGGISCWHLDGPISGNTIRGNSGISGGGIMAWGASPAITNNLIVGNHSTDGYAAAILWYMTTSGTDGTLINNTVVGNTGGSSIYLAGTAPTVANNIIAFNSSGIRKDSGYSPTITNNDVYNPSGYNYSWTPAPSGNISSDPLFVNRTGGDYHLAGSSPCIDTGDDTKVSAGWLDIDGQPRQVDAPDVGTAGTKVDIGADEYYLDYTNEPVVDRDLPGEGINGAGDARSNIRWADASLSIAYGDDFEFNPWPGPSWQIDKIVVWVVPDVPMWPAYYLGDHFSSITLFRGGASGALSVASSGTLQPGSNSVTTTDGTTISVGTVRYDIQGVFSDYETADGRPSQIWQVEFSNLTWTVATGATAVFGVHGTSRYDRLWFNHATAASGAYIRQFDASTSTPPGTTLVSGAGWFGGKGSDINVKVYAHPVQ